MDRIQEIYESYGDVTKKVGIDKVQKRFTNSRFPSNRNLKEEVSL